MQGKKEANGWDYSEMCWQKHGHSLQVACVAMSDFALCSQTHTSQSARL
jgi:hypothetical protein